MSSIVLTVLYLWYLLRRNGEMPFELIFPTCVSWATWLLWKHFLSVVINYFSSFDGCHYPAAIPPLQAAELYGDAFISRHIYLAVCRFLLPLQTWLNSTWTLALNKKRGKFSRVAWIYEAATWFVVIGDGTRLWRAGLPPKEEVHVTFPLTLTITKCSQPGFIWRECIIGGVGESGYYTNVAPALWTLRRKREIHWHCLSSMTTLATVLIQTYNSTLNSFY